LDLNQHIVRVYNLEATLFRVDTLRHSYVEVLDELGYFQFGHSKTATTSRTIKSLLATRSAGPAGDHVGRPGQLCR